MGDYSNFTEAIVIYPHQLYKNHPAIHKSRLHILVEEPLLFGDREYELRFHKQKLILHRASMQYFADHTLGKGRYAYEYWDYRDINSSQAIFLKLQKLGIEVVHVVDPTDDWLAQRIHTAVEKYALRLEWYESPNFLSTTQDLEKYLSTKNIKNHFFQTTFYKWQRERLNILIEHDQAGRVQPIGGKWTFDSENRKKLPASEEVPNTELPITKVEQEYIQRARKYVEEHFPDNPGETSSFIYCICSETAEKWFQKFLRERLEKFGPYQDALTNRSPFVFHAVITFALNIGLISPQWIIEQTLSNKDIPLASLEGFVRQVIGWREFMRFVYLHKGAKMRTQNHFNHTRAIPDSYYTATTNILPIDKVIQKLNKYAYAHHIERLMVLGNFMLLNQFSPTQVYNWFMEMFIDSYDWVMVPNIYGMSQYSDGGSIVTKPYVSGSNYIKKMSDYTGNPQTEGPWAAEWDTLYWEFIADHKQEFSQNPRMSMMVKLLEKRGGQ